MQKKDHSKILLTCLLFLTVFSACLTRKNTVLLQEVDKSKAYQDTFVFTPIPYRLNPGDAVGIEVFSFNPKTLEEIAPLIKEMNTNVISGISQLSVSGSDIYYLKGYVIDDSNDITLPMMGKIKIGALSLDSGSAMVQKKFNEFYKDAYVRLTYAGIRFTILGEINIPGKYNILQSRLSLFEALAMAGDFKEFARRDQVKIIRSSPTGAKVIDVNLLDKNIMSSPYYFLKSNDIVYVEPMGRKYLGFGSNTVQTVTTSITVLTSLLLVFNLLK